MVLAFVIFIMLAIIYTQTLQTNNKFTFSQHIFGYIGIWRFFVIIKNKANLRDLIAPTGQVILLKLDSNRRFFIPCDLEFWWMTSKNNRAPFLSYIELCASFQIHRWIQTRVIVQKRSIRVKTGDVFVLCDLEIWWMTLKKNRAPLLCYVKLCASFQSHRWIQTKVTVRKRSVRVKSAIFCPMWPRNLRNDLEK